MTDKHCRDCKFSGMDMDLDPYCAQPKVLAEHEYGLALHSPLIAGFCPSPGLPLFEPRRDVK